MRLDRRRRDFGRQVGMDSFKVFVANPAGLEDPALAVAATRVGAIGVLNAELGLPSFQVSGAHDKQRRVFRKIPNP